MLTVGASRTLQAFVRASSPSIAPTRWTSSAFQVAPSAVPQGEQTELCGAASDSVAPGKDRPRAPFGPSVNRKDGIPRRSTATVDHMSAGDFFGEIALLDGGPRSASVVADGPLTCLILLRKEFNAILAQEPQVALRVLRGATARLRRVDHSHTS